MRQTLMQRERWVFVNVQRKTHSEADALFNLCSSMSTPPAVKVDELIAAGINLRYKVRVK